MCPWSDEIALEWRAVVAYFTADMMKKSRNVSIIPK